jgi:uncharacterized caspase-like protein
VVVGNADYAEDSLLHTADDAQLLSAQLTEMNWDVRLTLNAGLGDLRRGIAALGTREAAAGEVLLFYFAGHALQYQGENFLVPVDAQLGAAGDLAEKCVSLQEVFALVNRSGARAAVVILDAGRPNAWRDRLDLDHGGLARVSAPPQCFVAFSTRPGTVTGGRNDHVYSKVLLKHLDKANASVTEILRQVKLEVRSRTADQQEPWDASTLTREVYFQPSRDDDGVPRFVHLPRAMPPAPAKEEAAIVARASANPAELTRSAQTRAQSGETQPEGAQLELPLRQSGMLWEEVFITRRGRLRLPEGGALYAFPSRNSPRLGQINPEMVIHVVGYVRTREGLFWMPLSRYEDYMKGDSPAWIFVMGTEEKTDFEPRMLVSSNTPDALPPVGGEEEPPAIPIPDNPGFVYSPHFGENGVVDVRSFNPGDRVRCPYTGRVFRVP